MIPFKDDTPTRTFPFITIGIIILNIAIYLWGLLLPADLQKTAYSYGAIPHNLLTFAGNQPIHPAATIFSSMFLHGGLFHVAGNMLYLWIFGDNIEDRLGHFRFLIFYLFAGVVAAYANAAVEAASAIPMIGASGAVSGVLGAYLLLFPHSRVHTLVFFGFFLQVVRIPAYFVIGFWAVIQFLNGLLAQGILHQSGIAWFAHIGGFLFGLITIKLWLPGEKPLH